MKLKWPPLPFYFIYNLTKDLFMKYQHFSDDVQDKPKVQGFEERDDLRGAAIDINESEMLAVKGNTFLRGKFRDTNSEFSSKGRV